MVVCPGEVQLEHLNGLRPIFDVIDKRPCLLVMPMPRYIIAGCCGGSTHIANRVGPPLQGGYGPAAGGSEEHRETLSLPHGTAQLPHSRHYGHPEWAAQ
jgi:hypothetical protein